MDYSPPDSSVHGILQSRILEWVAVPFSNNCELNGCVSRYLKAEIDPEAGFREGTQIVNLWGC